MANAMYREQQVHSVITGGFLISRCIAFFVLSGQVHAKELAASYIGEKQHSSSKLLGQLNRTPIAWMRESMHEKFVDDFSDRAPAESFHRANLDNVLLGKSSYHKVSQTNLLIPHRQSLAMQTVQLEGKWRSLGTRNLNGQSAFKKATPADNKLGVQHFFSNNERIAVVPRADMQSVTSVASDALIPRNVLFGNGVETFQRPTISPDGKLLAYVRQEVVGSVSRIGIWCRTVGKYDDRRITTDTFQGLDETTLLWAEDSRTLLYLHDPSGGEKSHLFALDSADSSVPRDLTPIEAVKVKHVRTNKHYPGEVLVEIQKPGASLFDVYRCRLADGELSLDTVNPGDVTDWFIDDEDFEVRHAVVRLAGNNYSTVSVRDGGKWSPLFTIQHQFTFFKSDREGQVIAFSKDKKSVLAISSLGRDTQAVVRLDVRNGQVLETISSNDKCDCATVWIDEHNKEVRMASFNYARRERIFFDKELEADFRRLEQASPAGSEIDIVSTSRDDQTWVVMFSRADGPPEYSIYDRGLASTSPLFASQPALLSYKLADMVDVRIRARDGLELVAYLTRVDTERATPLVLLVHGGPYQRDVWGFSEEVQWLANRGYAVLQVNFRGSAGYGKTFEQKGLGEWGVGMQHDLSDAVAWAIREGIALEDKICIYGYSYGGYACLVGMTDTPELYACGVEQSGISVLVQKNWTARMLKKINKTSDKERSPLEHVDKIRAPLFIGHGENDPRVSQGQSNLIAFTMKAMQLPVEYVVYLNEGHTISSKPNMMDFYGRVEQFLAKHLGGRAQPFETPEGSSATFPLDVEFKRKSGKFDTQTLETPDQTGRLRIHYRAVDGQLAEVERLGAVAPDTIKMADQYGRLPIHYAAFYGHAGVVEHLFAAEPVSVKMADQYGRLPIHYAAENGYADVVRCLGRVAPDTMKTPAGEGGRLPIHFAAISGHAAVVGHLGEAAPDTVMTRGRDGYRPIEYASLQGHSNVVQLLKELHENMGDKLDKESRAEGKKASHKSQKKKKDSGKGFR